MIIGRVGVKVVPDTRDFGDDLERKLNKIEREHELEVPVKLDIDKVSEQFDRAQKRLEADAKRNPIEIDVDLANDAAQSAARRMREKLDDIIGDIQVDLEIDPADVAGINDLGDEMRDTARETERAAAAADDLDSSLSGVGFSDDLERQMRRTDELLEEINAEINELDHLKNIDILLEIQGMSKAERNIENLRSKMEALRVTLNPEMTEEARRRVISQIADLADKLENELDNLEAQVEPTVGEAFYRRAQQRLAWLSRTRVVTLVPVVSAKAASAAATALAALSGVRLQGKLIEDLFDLFKNLDKNLPKVAALGLGIAGLSGWALSASANLFSMSKQLAQIGPILLGMPGLFAGAAIGIVTLVVALSDFGNRVPEVADAWRDLKPVIQDNFWAKAEAPMRRLTDMLMPQLRKGIADTATELGDLFGTFGEDLVRELTGTKALAQMFDDLASSIKIAKGGTKDYASIIRILGEVGASLLPRMSRYFVDVTSTFENFLKTAEGDGRLDMWIDRAIIRMRELGEVIGNFGGILTGLAKAADEAGGSTLREWADDLQRVEDKVKSPTFQRDLVGVLRAADEAMTNIANESGPGMDQFFHTLSETLSQILPLVGTTIGTMIGSITEALSRSGFQNGVVSFFEGIRAALDNLTPAFGPISDALGAILKLAGKMAESFSPAVATTLTILSDAVVTMAPYLERVVESLSGPLSGLLDSLAGPIDKIAKAGGPALEKVGDAIGAFVKTITPAVGRNADKLADFISESLSNISADDMIKLAEALGDTVSAILDLIGAIADSGDPADLKWLYDLTNTAGAWKIVAGGIQAVADAISGLNSKAEASPKGFLSNSWFKEFFTGTETGANTEGLLRPWWDDLKARMKQNWADMKAEFATMGSDIIAGLVEGFSNAWDNVIYWWDTAVTTVVDFVKGLFGIQSPSTVFAEMGRDIIRGLIQGLGEMIEGVLTFFSNLATSIKNLFVDAATWLVGAGRSMVQGLMAGIGTLATQPAALMGQIARQARDKFADAGSWLVERGSALVRGLRDGISNTAETVTTRLSQLATASRNLFAGAGSWLVQRGQDLVSGLRTGIGNVASTVTTALSTLATNMRNVFTSAGTWLVQRGREVVSGLRDGISRTADTVRTAASNLRGQVTSGIGYVANLLYSAGSSVVSGFVGGIRDSFWRVQSTLSSLTSMLPSWKGPPSTDRTILHNAGELVILGFLDGLESQYGEVKDSLRGLGDDIGDMTFSGPSVDGVSKSLRKDVSSNMLRPGEDGPDAGSAMPAKTVNFNYEIHNPITEPTSVTTTRTLREAQDQTGETP